MRTQAIGLCASPHKLERKICLPPRIYSEAYLTYFRWLQLRQFSKRKEEGTSMSQFIRLI